MKNDDDSKLRNLLRLKRYEEPSDEYFDNFVREARERRVVATASAFSFENGLSQLKGSFSKIWQTKWLVGASMGAAYAGIMAAVLLWNNEGAGLAQPNVIPASAEMSVSLMPVREVNFAREFSQTAPLNQPKEF